MCCVFVVAACGGGGGGGGDDQPSPDAQNVKPLTCSSIALCTTYDVKTFIGKVPVPEGGKVSDGLYRLAWVLDPDDIGETAGYHDDLDALAIRGGTFNWAGFFRDDIGTISTSGTMITFKQTQHCERGTDGSASTEALDYKYTATANELHLYSHVTRSDGVQWDSMKAYVLTSSPQDVCQTVSGDPTMPGDSAKCRVTNCACKFAVEGTVGECT
jgi:hypothetical protein